MNARHRDQVLFPVLQNRNYPHLALAAALEEENVRERGEREEDVSELAQKCSNCDCGSYFTCTDPVGLGVARAVSHIREPVHLEQSRATLSRTEPDRCAVELLQHRRRDSRARLFSLVRWPLLPFRLYSCLALCLYSRLLPYKYNIYTRPMGISSRLNSPSLSLSTRSQGGFRISGRSWWTTYLGLITISNDDDDAIKRSNTGRKGAAAWANTG